MMHRLAIAGMIVGCLAIAFMVFVGIASNPATWRWVQRWREWHWR